MSLWLTHPLLLPSLIVGVTIVLWATSLLPEFITALLFFTAAMTARIAPPEVIFGGFASSAFWLVFSGFVLGVAILENRPGGQGRPGAVGKAYRLLGADGGKRCAAELCPGIRDAVEHGTYCAADADCRRDGEAGRHS